MTASDRSTELLAEALNVPIEVAHALRPKLQPFLDAVEDLMLNGVPEARVPAREMVVARAKPLLALRQMVSRLNVDILTDTTARYRSIADLRALRYGDVG